MSGIPNKMLPVAVEMLPEGYRRLEYLESTGTQYIVTWYVPQIGDTLSITNLTLNDERGSIFVSTRDGNDPKFTLTNGSVLYYKYFSSGAAPAISRGKITPNSRLYIDGDGSVFVNGEKVLQVTAQGSVTTQLTISNGAAITFGQITASRNGALQLNLIPCLDAKGRTCMFDTVSRKPFYNARSGEFLYRLPGDGELPAGYTRLEYLESTGTQYIDTGVKLSNESEVQCEFMRLSVTDTTANLYGDETDKNSRFSCFFNVGSSNYSRWDFAEQMVTGKPLEVLTKYKSAHNATGVSLNGLQIVNFDPAEPFEAGGGLKLFGLRQAYISQARIYSFSISSNNQLQLNFIPCLDDKGVPCMFDTVTRRPFRNAATTGPDFLYG